jgi:hypothetical protein
MAADGFLSRWSRRKLDVREGNAVEAEPPVTEVPAAQVAPAVPVAPAVETEPAPPPPTLEDVKSLTPESDFARFIQQDVAPDVKNAALKKLFADPRYNVRDMMDVYADDYSQPDPIPESMLKQLVVAQALKLFEENADDVSMQTVAKSSPDDDPDLRLQQDDAAGPESGGDGAGRDAAAPFEPVPPGSGKLPEGDPG